MFLGLDLGTSAIKALLVDADGTIIGSQHAPLPVIRPHAGWSEQDPDDWWQATSNVVLALRDTHPREMAAVQAVGLSGQMHGLVALDADDGVLRPAICGTICARLCKQAGWTRIPHFRRCASNAVMPGFTALRPSGWQNRNHIYSNTSTILLPKDYLRLRMTGEKISEMSDAAGTLWLDVAARDWSDELLDASGLTRATMPRLVEGSEAGGRLRRTIADAWGMTKQPIVAGGGGDNAAAASTWCYQTGRQFSVMASGVVFTVTERFTPAPASGVMPSVTQYPTWHAMGVVLAASDCIMAL